MKLDKQLFNEIARKAAESPRLRMHYDLRNDENEQSQRMLNVLLPGTFVPMHRHAGTSETVACLEGPIRSVPFARSPCRLERQSRHHRVQGREV